MNLLRDTAIVFGMLFGIASLAAMAVFIVLILTGHTDGR